MAEDKKINEDLEKDSTNQDTKENLEEELEEIEAEIVDEDGQVIEDTNVESDEYLDKYQRLLADFNNYKKREEKQKEDFKKFAAGNLIEKLLPVLDNFDRALKDANLDDAFVKGIVMTKNEFWKILEKEGLSEIESDNCEFDPNFHQAVMTEESDSVKENYIIETYQKGYKLKDRVIRPSMVKVSK